MLGNCLLGIFVVFVLAIQAGHATDVCELIKEEFRRKREALDIACSDEAVLSAGCASNVRRALDDSEKAELEKECPTCPVYAVYFPRDDKRDYAFSQDTGYSFTAAIRELTMCAWVKLDETAGEQPYFVSYAVTGGFSNEIQLFASGDKIYMVIRNSLTEPAIFAKDNEWHVVCGTWKSRGGFYKIFVDGEISANGKMLRSGKELKRGGLWVVGNYQYSENYIRSGHTMRGEITMVNVWDRVLSDQEIYEFSFSCESDFSGNIKAWSDFRGGIVGEAELRDSSSCCSAFQ